MTYIDRDLYNRLKEISNLTSWNIETKLKEFLKEVKPRSTRTLAQNNAIHLYLSQVAGEMCNKGITVQDIMEKVKRVEIMPNGFILKEILWKPLLKAKTGKKSTTEHDKFDIDEVYEPLNKWLGQEFEIEHIPFPHEEKTLSELTGK